MVLFFHCSGSGPADLHTGEPPGIWSPAPCLVALRDQGPAWAPERKGRRRELVWAGLLSHSLFCLPLSCSSSLRDAEDRGMQAAGLLWGAVCPCEGTRASPALSSPACRSHQDLYTQQVLKTCGFVTNGLTQYFSMSKCRITNNS